MASFRAYNQTTTLNLAVKGIPPIPAQCFHVISVYSSVGVGSFGITGYEYAGGN